MTEFHGSREPITIRHTPGMIAAKMTTQTSTRKRKIPSILIHVETRSQKGFAGGATAIVSGSSSLEDDDDEYVFITADAVDQASIRGQALADPDCAFIRSRPVTSAPSRHHV
jgi:hypothetical protein